MLRCQRPAGGCGAPGKNFKIRGSSGKINIALDGLPTFPALPEGTPLMITDMHASESLYELERAYDDWKAGTWSEDPYFDMLIPTQVDPTMAAPGKHMMTVFVQYARPLADGPDARARCLRQDVDGQDCPPVPTSTRPTRKFALPTRSTTKALPRAISSRASRP